jgi:integrase/recombinase XerC
MRYPHIIEAYLQDLENTASAETYRRRRSVLARADAQLPAGVVAADPLELHRWLHRPDWKPATRSCYRDDLRAFHRWLHRRDVTSYDPADELDQIRIPRALPHPITDAELDAILTRATDRVAFWSLIAAYTGLRACEISGLDRRDITPAEVRVRSGKGGHARVVPCHELIWEAVAELPPGRVAPVSANVVSKGAGREYRRLGVSGSIHRCRHWFATRTLEACGDIRVVQELLGHSSVATTQIYTLVTDGARRAAVTALPLRSSGSPANSPSAAAAGSAAPPAGPPWPQAGAAGRAAGAPRTG